MSAEELLKKFNEYTKEIDIESITTTWEQQSEFFKNFWNNKILHSDYPPLTDTEIDEVVLILDKNAKGSTKSTIAVARVMIPQGVWRRLFKEIQKNQTLKNLLNQLFIETDEKKKIEIIDELYKINKGKKNSLTGKSGNAINTMLFAFHPKNYLAIISLNDRKKVIDYYGFAHDVDFERDNPGKQIIVSNRIILDGFEKLGIDTYPDILSRFLYRKVKNDWKPSEDEEVVISTEPDDVGFSEDQSTFYMEKELENFLIANWDKTELAKNYELLEEDGEMVSQQYPTDIGRIDILVKDKKTGQYVVIELKKNQTSDDTIGQLTRYMGWLEEHKTKNGTAKGIIIASAYDKKLYYALKKVKDVEVYTYQIDFKLKEFKHVPG
jgi:hypothetical protein